ncbi:hypothetical protein U7S25_004214 [Providencia rettgeri]|uniref:hypothetical protein n=1 Tax=Providencia rettgeri TaxID=587 RepID=UPI001CFE7216|nr:hypothetical protein [Providencia rettgeri]EMB0753496.1 hypothetical protein [Providencia rettgeri]MCB4843306.1 hypothetical protein [Providencia rettgeri]
MADYLAVDNRLRSSNKQKVLAATIRLMDELKKEREQGIANNRPRYMDISYSRQVNSNNLITALNHPPLPPHIQQLRDEEFRRGYYRLNPDEQHFDPYRDIPELPMGGRKTGD